MVKNPVFQAEKCPLTSIEKPTLKVKEDGIDQDFGKPGYQWFYPYLDDFLIIVDANLFDDEAYWQLNKAAIFYLIENGIWPQGKMVDKPLLELLISSSGIPTTPWEKLQEVLSYMLSIQTHFGQRMQFLKDQYASIARKTGLVTADEFEALVDEAKKHQLLEITIATKGGLKVILSINGWEVAHKRKEAKYSNMAFVAMSFDPSMIQIYNNWIEPAITESGFKPHIIFNEHQESDVTINDAILSGIKRAKFTIADFTHHKSGVYFEAGYALGRGQKVIYTCHQDDIGKAHFDTRNYQHLVWQDGQDLKKKLMDKIEVFIKN